MKRRNLLILLLLSSNLHGKELPNHPKPQPSHKFENYSFIISHSIYAGALAFDEYETSKGVSNGCEESSSNLGAYPSNKKIVTEAIIEYSLVTGMDYLLKRTHVKGLSFVGAGIGTFKHIHGGYQWLQTGCV